MTLNPRNAFLRRHLTKILDVLVFHYLFSWVLSDLVFLYFIQLSDNLKTFMTPSLKKKRSFLTLLIWSSIATIKEIGLLVRQAIKGHKCHLGKCLTFLPFTPTAIPGDTNGHQNWSWGICSVDWRFEIFIQSGRPSILIHS